MAKLEKRLSKTALKKLQAALNREIKSESASKWRMKHDDFERAAEAAITACGLSRRVAAQPSDDGVEIFEIIDGSPYVDYGAPVRWSNVVNETFHMGKPVGAENRRVNSNEVAVATLRWSKVSAGVYHAPSPWGLYTIDGNNAGRNRWTVTYPDGDYGMCDALAEAKLWAESDNEQRSKRAGK